MSRSSLELLFFPQFPPGENVFESYYINTSFTHRTEEQERSSVGSSSSSSSSSSQTCLTGSCTPSELLLCYARACDMMMMTNLIIWMSSLLGETLQVFSHTERGTRAELHRRSGH